MEHCKLALAILLVICATYGAAGSAPRALLQGRSADAPGQNDDAELPRGRPEDVAAVGAQLTGPNAHKFLVPGAASEFAKDGFIVQTSDVTPEDVEAIMGLVRGRAMKVTDLNGPAFQGFALQLPPGLAQQASVMQELIDSAAVTTVAADMIVHAVQGTQTGATWGLDRIDQQDLPVTTTYTYGGTAAGVTAYIIDTGILTTHTEFGGRAKWGRNYADRKNYDCNGHGTHCAGTVGGARYGVAKGVNLVAVKVLNCNGAGYTSWIVSGINWAVSNCAGRKCVGSMSLGGGIDAALDNAVAGATAKGVTMVVAAGNSNQDACYTSPARAPTAITVGATTNTDYRASYSNYGSCLDIFAPGSTITSSWIGSKSAINTISGTSMATPHVAGVVALHLATLASAPANGNDVTAVVSAITGKATPSKVLDPGPYSPNLLLYSA